MQHHSTATVESKSVPGVRYILHRKNDVRLAILTRMTVEPKERLSRLLAEARALVAGPQSGYDTLRFDALLSVAGAEVTTLEGACVLCFLQGTEGLLIDGKAPTPAEFMVNAPDALRREVVTAIQEMLSAAEDEPQHPAQLVN